MILRVTNTDLDSFVDKLRNLSIGQLQRVRKVLKTEAVVLIGDAQRSMAKTKKNKTGRRVTQAKRNLKGKIVKRGIKHYPSLKGFPPSIDTGNLANSLQTDERPLTIVVGTNVKYAPWLEKGTRHMEERPFLGPALKRATPKIIKKLEKIVGE